MFDQVEGLTPKSYGMAWAFSRAFREICVLHDIACEVGYDVGELSALSQRVARTVQAPFRDISADIMWVVCLKNAMPVMIQAFRCDMITDLHDYVAGEFVQSFYPEAIFDHDAIRAPRARGIGGRVVYQGEFWLDNKLRFSHTFAGGNAALFCLFGFALCLQRWPFDYLYAITRKEVALRVTAWGISVVQPDFLCWHVPPKDTPKREWLAMASQPDAEFRVGHGLQYVHAMLAPARLMSRSSNNQLAAAPANKAPIPAHDTNSLAFA
ncbi:MAG: hypothetical protein AAF352_06880 [Pseudomonadota bacterium]